ncbi:UNVERIFIED_CONTAM: hypothetical protein NCL1_20965 [Trichonephila clavipes]
MFITSHSQNVNTFYVLTMWGVSFYRLFGLSVSFRYLGFLEVCVYAMYQILKVRNEQKVFLNTVNIISYEEKHFLFICKLILKLIHN